MLEEQLCRAFCQGVHVRKVPVGYAISTGFTMADGDPIGFYAVEIEPNRLYRLEDDGTVVPLLEAIGVNLKSDTRRGAFNALLAEYRLSFDEDNQLICSDSLTLEEIPPAALRFMAMLVRLQDFHLLTPKIVESTFREDALAAIRARFGGRVRISESTAFDDESLSDYVIDAVFSINEESRAAIYIGTSPARADEAVMLRMDMLLQGKPDCKVLLVMESTRPPPGWPERILARAQNRLDGVAVFRGHERDAMDKIDKTVFGDVIMPMLNTTYPRN